MNRCPLSPPGAPLSALPIVVALLAIGGCDFRSISERTPAPSPQAARVIAQDRATLKSLGKGDSHEASAWLAPVNPNHVIVGMENEEARRIVAGFYASGAVKVYVADIFDDEGMQTSVSFVVELPRDPETRRSVFAWEAESGILRGGAPTDDVGQRYLAFTTE